MKHEFSTLIPNYCIACHCVAKVSLPTDCPGFMLEAGDRNLIRKKEIDFVNGEWKDLKSRRRR